MSENCDTGLWRRILRTGLSEGGLTFYELDMVKVNSSDDSSRCLVKSGRIMTGRAKYSRESEGGEVSSVWSLGHSRGFLPTIPRSMGGIHCFQPKGEQGYTHVPGETQSYLPNWPQRAPFINTALTETYGGTHLLIDQ